MHLIDNFQDDYFNVNAALDTIGGVAGQIIQAKNMGKQLTANEQQIAMQSIELQKTLAQQNANKNSLGAGGITTIVLVGGAFLLILFILYKIK